MDEPQRSPSVQHSVEIGDHAQVELQSVGKCRLAGWLRRELLTNELGVTGQNNAAYSIEDELPSLLAPDFLISLSPVSPRMPMVVEVTPPGPVSSGVLGPLSSPRAGMSHAGDGGARGRGRPPRRSCGAPAGSRMVPSPAPPEVPADSILAQPHAHQILSRLF